MKRNKIRFASFRFEAKIKKERKRDTLLLINSIDFFSTLCHKSLSRKNSFTLLQENCHAKTGKFKGEQCHVIA
jgi:hypothetical protein